MRGRVVREEVDGNGGLDGRRCESRYTEYVRCRCIHVYSGCMVDELGKT